MSTPRLRLAMTVDDLFMWPGLPFPEGSSPQAVSRQLIDAFTNNGVKQVYAFSCTRPVEGTATVQEVLDAWCSAGPHVGNHTHYHCALNLCSVENYERYMDRSEVILRPWIEHSPTRYFRFAFDMWGERSEKTDRVMLKLARSGFNYAPISMWFSDTFFMLPHFRTLAQKDTRGRRGPGALHRQVDGAFEEPGRRRSRSDGTRGDPHRADSRFPARRSDKWTAFATNGGSRRRVHSSRGGDARPIQRCRPSIDRAAISQLHAEVVRGHGHTNG